MIRGIPLATIAVLALLILATGIVSAAPQQQTVVNICSRTPEVQSAILNRVPGATCSTVTDTQLAGITSLTISGHSNASFVSGDFAGLTNLNSLYLDRNNLMTLEADLFDGLTNLENLSLSGNNLTTLEEDLFDGLTNLTFLNLGRNNLMTLEADLFDGLTSLTRLNLDYNSLMTLEADLFDGLTNLTFLILDYNSLMTLDADLFDGLTSLNRLFLDYNSLMTLDADLFDGLTNLNLLHLTGNNLTTLEADLFDGLTKLEELSLTGNNLTTLEADLFDGLTNLGVLYLDGNNLMTLEADLFDGLTSLTRLDLSVNNSLMTLEADLFDGLTNLEELYLSNNSLMTLEADLFDGLTNLEELYLNNNSLMTLEADLFDGLTNLNWLFLNNNSLMTLDEDLFDGLTNLNLLHLHNNSLMTLDEDLFAGLTTLGVLLLHNNSLMTLEADFFDGLTNLNWLFLNNNSLMTLDEDLFDGLTNLNLLHLHNNSLMTLDEDLFDGLTGLRTLKLECNSLTALNLVLFDPVMTTLSSLDISGNDFATPPTEMDIRAKITSLRFLTAGDNIRCKRVTVMFGAADYTVPEGDTVEVTVSLSADPERTVTIPLAATEQGGATSADYSVPTGVTFNAGDTEQTITFSATQDEVDDDDESVLLAFGALPSGVSAGTPATATVSITDDDGAGVSVSKASLTIAEGSSDTYTIVLDSQPTADVTVTINDPPGNTDVTAEPASLTFSSTDWNSPMTVTVSAGRDDDAEDETATVTHTVTSADSSYSVASANRVVVSITDDDDPQVTVMFGAADYTVPEGDTVEVTVSLSADPERTVTIPLAATEQGGATSADYSVPTGVTFNAGDTEQTITFSATQDEVDDDDESVLLAFGALPSGVSAGTPATATVSITDDDGAGVSVSKASLTIAEGSSDTYTIVLDSQPTADVTVTINDPPGNTDVTAEPASLTFSSTDWNSPMTVTVSAGRDDDAEDETATVTHTVTSADSSYSVASANRVVVSITDDDDPQVTVMFGAADYTVPEGDTVEVTVSLSADPERTVTIPLAATEQGGATSADYSVPTGVTFNAGDTEQTITFSATQDEVDDDDESVLLAFGTSLPSGVSAGTPATATVSITDDDDPQVTVMFGAADYTVPEGDTVEVTVSLSADPERTVTIPLAATEQGGATSADYSVPTGVTFNAGDTEQTITFSATQDEVDDDDESVLLAFGTSLPSGVSAGTPATATVSITDDDDPQVTVMFGAADYTVPEGDTVEVTVSLSADPERTVTIPLAATEQGGATSADYSVPTGVTFNAGDTEQTITFSATQDTVDDDDESVLLAFGTSLPSGVSAGTPATATVSITDDDDPQVTVMFGAADYTVPEGDTVEVTVSLSADPERTVTIPLAATEQGGATSADYSVPTGVTFNAGGTEQTITFSATQDTVDDDDESVLLAFGTSLPSGVSAGTPATATVSITDDDDPQVTVMFGAADYTVPEGDTVEVTVSLSADPERTVTIPLAATEQGGATSADYSVPTGVTFNAGGTEQTITFSATQDEVDDDDESVLLAFGALPSGVSAGTPATATVSITDDDGAGVSVSKASLTIAEGSSDTYTIVLDSQPTADVTVTINDPPGNTDVTAEPASLTFSSTDWNSPMTVTVSAGRDDDAEDETATVTHTVTSADSSYSVASANRVVVSITDDDDPQVTVMFGAADYTVPEGDTVEVTVSLSADPERTVTIPLAATEQGGATSADYSVPTGVTFNAGDTEQTITFSATQDTVDDDDESVLLAFGTSLPSGVSAGTPATATVSITDDDDPQVTVMFGAADYTVPEGDTVEVTVSLSADPERTVTIPLAATEQGGATSADYSVPTGVTFNAGGTEQTITFSATQDEVDDDDESVLLAFGALPSGVSAGTPATATVSITDDDGAGVSVSKASLTIAEGSSDTYTIVLDSQPTADVTVTINDPPGNTDVTAEPASLTFSSTDWNSPMTVTVSAGRDDDAEDETATVTHTVTSADSSYSVASANRVVVSITDDDDPQVTVMFGAADYTVPEGDTVEVTVSLSADPERTVTIPLAATEQGGATSADYSVPTGVTFNAGGTEQTITFSATQDEVDDDDESVLLAFGTSLPSGVSAGTPATATVSITDDDDPQVTVMFGAADYTVPEGDTVEVTVSLSADPERTVTIPLAATEQGGATSADYSVPTGVTFNAGDTEQTITFSATQDEVDDDDESVLLAFGTSLPSGVSAGTPATATVSITDDDDPQVTVMFGAADYTVPEGDTVEVTVSLSADPERTVTIPLAATEQGGATSADYSVPTGVTFNAGGTEQTITFSATQDTVDDDDESVLLAFGTSLPSGVSAGTPHEATVTIKQTQLVLDCSGTTAVWCADLGFSDRTAENWGWAYLRYGEGWDPPASLSDEDFRFRGVNYTVRTMELRPGTHPSMPNAWSRWQQGYSHFAIGIFWNQTWGAPSREHYQDWVLNLDGLELPFKDALRHGASFIWVGAEIQEVFNDWTPSTVNMIGIEEVAAADQETNPLLPWAPMQVDAPPQGPNRLLVVWAKPAWYFTGLPAPTKYIVQWKLASASWDNSAYVSEREVAAGSNFHSLTIDGLTEDVLYSVRVIAGNDAGNGPPSEETLGRPQDDSPQLIAQTINGDRLTLRFSNRLSTGSVPAGTAFTVLADGGLIEVDSVAIRGNEVVLTLDRAVTAAAHSVKVRYDKPTGPTGVFLRDISGNHAHIRQHHELLEVVNITPDASVQPLTARFANEPANHNGRDNFTFDIEFSEPVWVAIGFPRDDMLEVTGGTVVSAPWRERRSDAITFHVRPDTMGDIVIVLPGNQVCEGIIEHTDWRIEPVAGAPCAIGNRKLTNSLTMTVPGPLSTAHQVLENTPAQGQPLIEGIPEPGQTLSANTNTITDADGLENAVFRYQWLADDAESTGATGATYTVESGDVGRAIRVRVTFTDDGGNEETLTSAPTVVTAAGLQLGSAAVDGATMKLTYNEELDTGVTLSTTAFAVEVNGSSLSLIGVGVGQSNVLLLLNPAVEAGDTVMVDYTAPDGPDFIRDTRGRKAASFSGQAVTNDTASVPLTATIHDVPLSHNGQDAFTFELRFSADPQPDFSYTTVRDHAFIVTGGSVTYVRRLEPGKNARWEITVTPGSGADVAIALNATTDCFAQGAICTEDGGMLSGGPLLAVPGPNTPSTGLPTIAGRDQVGETLTADTSGIEDEDGLNNAAFAYQWLADDAEINGATVFTYTLVDTDAGKTIQVRVTFTDDGGNDETLTSAATDSVVAAAPPANTRATGLPTIAGRDQVGETLTADTSGIEDEDGLNNAAFAYQWLADDAEINGATVSTYTLVDTDEGKAIKVRVSFTDDTGNDEILTSAATDSVVAAAPPANTPSTGLPTIAGRDQVGETLTADTTGVEDDDGLDAVSFNFQWLADDADIEGATGSSYTITEADEGLVIQVRVSFTDDAGNSETLTSEGTEAVASSEPENPVEPPPAPQNLVATVNSDGSVTLTWEAPDDDGITGYRILRRRPTEEEDTLLVYVADTESTATTYTDTNVTAGVQHAYRVMAINGAGAGPVSNFVNVTP